MSAKRHPRDAVNPFPSPQGGELASHTPKGTADPRPPLQALTTQAGGEFFAPPTSRSNPAEKPRPRPKDHPLDRISSSIYNMRLTDGMHAELRTLKARTGITVQAHVRRAILDYLHEMRTKHPEYFSG